MPKLLTPKELRLGSTLVTNPLDSCVLLKPTALVPNAATCELVKALNTPDCNAPTATVLSAVMSGAETVVLLIEVGVKPAMLVPSAVNCVEVNACSCVPLN